jgi:hypothetical protein
MARSVRDAKLDSRAARAKLKPSGKPYYRALDPGLHLGYRKGVAGGRWVMRWYTGAGAIGSKPSAPPMTRPMRAPARSISTFARHRHWRGSGTSSTPESPKVCRLMAGPTLCGLSRRIPRLLRQESQIGRRCSLSCRGADPAAAGRAALCRAYRGDPAQLA